MSEFSRAISRARLCDIFKANRNAELKEAFRLGWDAREELLNKRVAEIEKASTMKERQRCAMICDSYAENSRSPSNFASNCAEWIRRGK
jgi:hypothetical protein